MYLLLTILFTIKLYAHIDIFKMLWYSFAVKVFHISDKNEIPVKK